MFAVAVVAAAGLCGYISFYSIISDTTAMFNRSYDLTITYTKLADVQSDLESYAATMSSDSLMAFYSDRDALLEYAHEIRDSSSYTERGVKLGNIANMLEHYLIGAEDAMNAKRGRNVEAYTRGFENSVTESEIITEYIKEVINDDVLDNAQSYSELNTTARKAMLFNGISAVVVIAATLVFIIRFSIEITRPVTRLADYAKEISDGNFDVKIESEESTEELDILYSAFGTMASSVNEYVTNLTERAELEKSLSDEKLSNLRMKSALHEIELKALQAQINPHFIFNTINIGAKMALLQGDDETCHYLENAADIFRYNLRGLDTKTTLKDELDNVASYIFLLKTRFGEDSFSFEKSGWDIPAVSRLEVPRLSLQPIVENAYIHGISAMESGGRIWLDVSREEKYVVVKISDNGIVIDKENIEKLLSGENLSANRKSGHTTGIGVSNVLERLRLSFGYREVMDIESREGETSFIIRIPYDETED